MPNLSRDVKSGNASDLILQSVTSNAFESLLLAIIDGEEADSLETKMQALRQLTDCAEQLECDFENKSTFFHWTAVASAFSTAAVLTATATLNPLLGFLVAGASASGAFASVGGAILHNKEATRVTDQLKRIRIVIGEGTLLDWACLWGLTGFDLFCKSLLAGSKGNLSEFGITRPGSKLNALTIAVKFAAQSRGLSLDEMVVQLGEIKNGVRPQLVEKIQEATRAALPSVKEAKKPAENVVIGGESVLLPVKDTLKEVLDSVAPKPEKEKATPTLKIFSSLSIRQRAVATINSLKSGGFQIDEVMGSQIIAIAGNQRGGKGTLAGLLTILSKADNPALTVEYFTAGIDIYPFACNLHSALDHHGRAPDEADKLVARELVQFLKKLEGSEPYSNQNLLLVVDEMMRLTSLMTEEDRSYVLKFLLSRFEKTGATLILVLHASNLTAIAGKETGGLAATFKEGINFIGCTTQAIAVGALRKMNVASGAYFKANPNNFGEPIKGGELGLVPQWLKSELHPGNGQPDPVRSLLKIFPELQQEHKAASLPENEKLGDMDDVSRLEFISQLEPDSLGDVPKIEPKAEDKEDEHKEDIAKVEVEADLTDDAYVIDEWLEKNRADAWVKFKGKKDRDSSFVNFLSESNIKGEDKDKAIAELLLAKKIELSDDGLSLRWLGVSP